MANDIKILKRKAKEKDKILSGDQKNNLQVLVSIHITQYQLNTFFMLSKYNKKKREKKSFFFLSKFQQNNPPTKDFGFPNWNLVFSWCLPKFALFYFYISFLNL